jgi:hypothetical protein
MKGLWEREPNWKGYPTNFSVQDRHILSQQHMLNHITIFPELKHSFASFKDFDVAFCSGSWGNCYERHFNCCSTAFLFSDEAYRSGPCSSEGVCSYCAINASTGTVNMNCPYLGAHSSLASRGVLIQAGRSRIRFPMRSLDFLLI